MEYLLDQKFIFKSTYLFFSMVKTEKNVLDL